jgi:hypothetical protein
VSSLQHIGTNLIPFGTRSLSRLRCVCIWRSGEGSGLNSTGQVGRMLPSRGHAHANRCGKPSPTISQPLTCSPSVLPSPNDRTRRLPLHGGPGPQDPPQFKRPPVRRQLPSLRVCGSDNAGYSVSSSGCRALTHRSAGQSNSLLTRKRLWFSITLYEASIHSRATAAGLK